MWAIRGYCNDAQRLRFDYVKASIAQEVAFGPFRGNRVTRLLHNVDHSFRLEHPPHNQPFRAFPHLRSLHVINEDLSGLLEALQCGGRDGIPVVCPVLEDLAIECCFDNERLAQSVRVAEFQSDVVAGRFRERLKELVVALQARTEHGSRLKSLRWSELEKKALRGDRSRRATETFVIEGWGLGEDDPDLRTLRSLVDGEVNVGEVSLYLPKSSEVRT